MSTKKTRRFEPPGYRERLANVFEDSGLSIQALADKAGARHWEATQFLDGALGGDFTRYERLAVALGVSWVWLLVGDVVARRDERTVKQARKEKPPESRSAARGRA